MSTTTRTSIFLLLAGLASTAGIIAAPRADTAETVMVTFRPKPGHEQQLAAVIADHWATARKMNLVEPDPHLTVRLKDEAGRTVFVDTFTWRDRDIPDNAPAAILTIWSEMNRLTEKRDGRPGLEIAEVMLLAPTSKRN
jgi:hypothetical protein